MTASVVDSFPLSHLQWGMLYHAHASAAGGVDLQQSVWTVRGPLDPARLTESWQRLVADEPSLRTRIVAGDDGRVAPTQDVLDHVDTPLDFVEWQGDDALEQFLADDRAQGFDLATAPLVRGTVFQTEDDAPWRIVWTTHHILHDGRSLALLFGLWLETYAALSSGRQLPFQARTPYREFVRWLHDRDVERDRDFWQRYLAGFTATTPLPTSSFHRGDGQQIVRRTLDADTTARLHAQCTDAGATLTTAMHAAWGLVLSRTSRESDVVFGATRSGRFWGPDDRDQQIGLYIQTVPVRCRVDEQASGRDLLGQIAHDWRQFRQHEHVPLASLQTWSDVAPGTPLFESLVVYDRDTLSHRLEGTYGDWDVQEVQLRQRPNLPLTLLGYGEETLSLDLLSERHTFEPGVAERLLDQVVHVLQALAESVDQPLHVLSRLPAAQRVEILETWNASDRVPTRALCLHQPFETQAEEQPDAAALACGHETWTYETLDRWSNRLAHRLAEHGATAGTRIGVCLPRSPELVGTLIAIAKTGATYVPLDADAPAERLSFIAQDADLTFVLTHPDAGASLDEVTTVQLDSLDLDQASDERPAADLDADRTAYIIYTSGSTGQPKGVSVTHRAALNTLDWVNDTFDVGPDDRLLFVTSVCFDLSVYDVFGTLAAGASLRIATRDDLRSPQRLSAYLDGEVTFWDSAPAFLQQVAPYFGHARNQPPRLRLVFLSGDWIPVTLPGALNDAFPGVDVISLGGATEAAIWSNWHRALPMDSTWPSVPYGKPIRNSWYHVLDGSMEPVPVGAPGELFIGGACVAEGYHAREALTAERFLPDPFQPGERLYRTGDLARYDAHGVLEFLGRADHQVKVRGYRVELGEIEHALTRHPDVVEAVVVAPRDASGSRTLVAAVTVHSATSPSPDMLRDAVAQFIPDYMVPSRIEVLDELPLNSNGKVDRKALEARPTNVVASASDDRPRTDLERHLVALWRELLGVETVGIHDSFFDLGGHSLLAVQMIAGIKTQLGRTLPLETVLSSPTIAKLAALLHRELEARPSSSFVVFNPDGTKPPIFLIAGIGGHVFSFRRLAALLGEDQPVFAAKAIGFDGGEEPPDRVEAIADRYLREIRTLVPDGPYFLGGYSFGALVAFELAVRLRDQGEQVPLIAVLDCLAPGYPKPDAWPVRAMKHLRTLTTMSWRDKRDYLADRVSNLRRRIYRVVGLRTRLARTVPGVDDETQRNIKRVWSALDRAKAHYRPRHVLDADFALFRAEEGFDWAVTTFDDPLLGWERYSSSPILTFSVPGHHARMFDEGNVEPLAADLQACLVQSQRAVAPPQSTAVRNPHDRSKSSTRPTVCR